MAYNNLSHICITADDSGGAAVWGTRALELAERLDDIEARVYALINIGAAEFRSGRPEGAEKLERSVTLARQAGLDELAGRALFNMVYWPLRDRSYELASANLEAGLEYCGKRGLDLWQLFFLACRARLELDQGRWSEAEIGLARPSQSPHVARPPRLCARCARARARPAGRSRRLAPARRGARAGGAFWGAAANRPGGNSEGRGGLACGRVVRRGD